jgi:predicted nuclease with RNAse H fold
MSESTLTLGIDLAVADEGTAACSIHWEAGRGVITNLTSTWSNDELRELIGEADWTGIDTPFSWPVRFRKALSDHGIDGGWPADYRSSGYQLRTTDVFVKKIACRPLSVSTNLLGITAMRCARLLQEIGEQRGKRLSLTGEDHIVEIYPAASLIAWGGAAAGFNHKGYKNGTGAKEARAQLVLSLLMETDQWLDFTPECQQACIDSHDVLDSLIAALTTRTAQLGMTHEPETDDQRTLSAIEGWIHVPEPGTLALLGGSESP